jgi:hypothetical protein
MPPVASAPVPRHTIDLADCRERLVRHRIYGLVNSAARLRRFMESHVFAVWDFQSLLKAMQQRLTCTTIPWVPTLDPEARRLVNEIVLDEESDELPEGGAASHFELYLEGMRAAGADTGPIDRMIDALRTAKAPQVGQPAATVGEIVAEAMRNAGAPQAAQAFVRESFAVIEQGSTHGIVAAFTYGREDVIPDMFRSLVSSLASRDPAWARFHWYLERHESWPASAAMIPRSGPRLRPSPGSASRRGSPSGTRSPRRSRRCPRKVAQVFNLCRKGAGTG